MSSNMRQAARKFVEYWTFQRGSEKGEDQQFWNSLLRDVLGVADVERHIQYQVPVPMAGTTKFLDAWIPETRVLIEQKSRGVNLDAPQASHGGKTPYQQAVEYDNARPYGEKARWIVVCNFDEIRVHDMENPLAPPQRITLADLPKEISRLGFLVDATVKSVREKEKDISIKAGRIVGELYKALLKRYAEPDSPKTLKALNRLCVRLVFVFYAEDADIFPKDAFWNFLNQTEAKNLRRGLLTLFRTLDIPDGSNGTKNERDPYLEPELAAFPYTNGGLFKDVSDAEIPPLDEEIRQLLIKSADFDWRDISPTIFGALFESTLNPETRRAGGMVYTSVENIHKVIDPLFLDDLTRRVDELVGASVPLAREGHAGRVTLPKSTRNALLALQAEIAALKFLDPACGSGNFLTETYLCLRRLENRIIAALQKGQAELDLGLAIKVSIAQFHGIEINDFAVAVAKTALWIAEAQMRHETAEILHREPDYLPLKDYANIIEGNALRMDWPQANYIMGNPPFIGARMMAQGSEQKKDIETLFGDIKDVQDLDYVCGWYKKAAATDSLCAFVSTNSICQGAQVPILWGDLIGKHGATIDFAHQTFRWDNESTEKAAVHCVIVGFHAKGATPAASSKTLFSPTPTIVSSISPYLTPGPSVFVTAAKEAAKGFPKMNFGNQPRDGGHFILSPEERDAILAAEPEIARWIRLYIGAEEFIKGKLRYCFWLKGATPADIAHSKTLYARVAAVREFRLASKAKTTNSYAKVPHLFAQITQPDGVPFLLVPRVSSERRRYIPIGYMDANVIASDAVQIVPNATLYQFGVLTSSVHMAWMRTVAGRLEMRYRYSKELVYNTFPWPDAGGPRFVAAAVGSKPLPPEVREKIEKTAQRILDVRARYPDCSFAELYDENLMPADLRAAHAANDRAVFAAYGLAADTPEPEIVAHLFKLYNVCVNSGKGVPRCQFL